jgi:hypothetical protein
MGGIAPKQTELVEIRYRGHRVAPPRKVCRTEVVRRSPPTSSRGEN